MSTYVLTLAGMQFHGRHGVYAEETVNGQPFEITVKLTLSLPAGPDRDQLRGTIDYCRVHDVVRLIAEGPPHRLIETVADLVATALLHSFPAVERVEVDVLKPKPPVDFPFRGVSALVVRSRPKP